MMRKRFIFIIAVFMISLLSISGCGAVADRIPQLSVPAGCRALWDLDIGLDGYEKAGGSYTSEWICNDIYLQLSILPADSNALHRLIGNTPGGNPRYKEAAEDGITCYTAVDAIAWDATEENGEWISGTNYSKSIVFEQNSLLCSLSGDVGDEGISLDIVSSRTARILTGDPDSKALESSKLSEVWTTGFVKGVINLSISVSPPPFGQTMFDELKSSESAVLTQDGGYEYIEIKGETQPDAPFHAFVASFDGDTLVTVRCGVPYDKRNDLSREELDVINIGLLQSILSKIE